MNKIGLALAFLFLSLNGFQSFASATPADGFYDNAKGSPLLSLIQSAQRQIDIEVYEMADLNVLNALRAAMKRGIKLRIIQEPTPFEQPCKIFENSMSSDPACNAEKQFLIDAKRMGATYIPYSKLLCGTGNACFEHGKMVIIDQRTIMLSTGNFNPTNLCDLSQNPKVCNRDFSYVISTPAVVKTFSKVFENDLLQRPYDLRSLLASSGVANQITVSPLSMTPILNFIQLAKSSIVLENQYITDPSLVQALLQAAKRGVKIYLMVSSICSFGPPKAEEIQRLAPIYAAFAQAGIQARFFSSRTNINGKPGYLHAKAIMVDQKYAWLGSVNGSTTALNSNREFGLFFANQRDVYALATFMSYDFSSPGAESFQESAHCSKD